MTLPFTGFLLALFGLSLVLITLSLRLLRGTGTAGEAYPFGTRFFLIALRVAIGWHCFVEGMEKIATPNWSSEVYLRESVGPASGFFRDVAGDRLIAKVTVGDDDAFPAELDREWQNYFNAFAAYYELDPDQRSRAQSILDQRKNETLVYLTTKSDTVTKIAPYPPDLKIEMTMKQRLEEHQRLLDKTRAAEAKFPSNDKDVHSEWKTAKADLAKWRVELKKSIDAETGKTKVALQDVLTSEQKQQESMPDPKTPLTSWRLLEVSDFLVKWSLVVLGACLMLGLLSRVSSFATALLIFSFYAAMPPLPGWPESPRLEGHYLLINKTLIEVIALLALAFLPTGRWAGLDGLLGLCCCGKAKTPATKT
jgi:uncharacterized membrane protein YphA (DoxX/SURF4 family)